MVHTPNPALASAPTVPTTKDLISIEIKVCIEARLRASDDWNHDNGSLLRLSVQGIDGVNRQSKCGEAHDLYAANYVMGLGAVRHGTSPASGTWYAEVQWGVLHSTSCLTMYTLLYGLTMLLVDRP